MIHTVGPVWHGGTGGEDELLADCYKNSLRLAVENEVKSIAFPAISTGVYHFPRERACGIAVNTVREFLAQDQTIEKVIFTCFDMETYQLYLDKLNAI